MRGGSKKPKAMFPGTMNSKETGNLGEIVQQFTAPGRPSALLPKLRPGRPAGEFGRCKENETLNRTTDHENCFVCP